MFSGCSNFTRLALMLVSLWAHLCWMRSLLGQKVFTLHVVLLSQHLLHSSVQWAQISQPEFCTYYPLSECTCFTHCSSLTTGNHSIAPHGPHWDTSTPFKRKSFFFFLPSTSKDNLKFKFCTHISQHTLKCSLRHILFKMTNYRKDVYLISSDTLFRCGERCAEQILYMQSR